MSPIDTYRIHIPGHGSVLLPAASPDEARQKAMEQLREKAVSLSATALDESNIKVQLAELPADAGYDYVRRRYGMEIEAGQRVRLKREKDEDREGWVVYPGNGTAYAHVWLDGEERPARVDPEAIEVLPVAELRM